MRRNGNSFRKKIHDQGGEIDKQREKCQNLRREFKGAEEEHNRRFTILEHEMEQLKTSKKITETLAPRDIFRGRTTTSSANPWMKFDLDTKSGSTYVPDPLKHTTRSTDEPVSEKTKGEYTSNRHRNDGPVPPKVSVFAGKSEWKPCYMQFNNIANKYNWDKQQRLDRLIEFCGTKRYSLSVRGKKDYDVLVQKLNQRFGNKDLPHTIRRQLQEAKKLFDESLEDFSERVQEMATDGCLNTPEHVVDTISVDAFLKGCSDKKAALFAMEKNPTTIDQALQCVKNSIHKQKILLGYKNKKPQVKRVQFDAESDEELTERKIRQVKLLPLHRYRNCS